MQPWVLFGLQIKRYFLPKDLSNEEPGRGWVACRLSKTFPTSEASPPSSLLLYLSEVSETFQQLLEEGSSVFGAGRGKERTGEASLKASWSLAPLPPPLYQGQTIFTLERSIGGERLGPRAWRMGAEQCFSILSSPSPLRTGASAYFPLTGNCHSRLGLQGTLLNAANLSESVWSISDLPQHPFTYLRSIRLDSFFLFPLSLLPILSSLPAECSLLSALGLGNLLTSPFTQLVCKLRGACRPSLSKTES